MNVLFLDSIEKEVYGGMEEWIRLVASGLRERGLAVFVAGREDSEFMRRVHKADPQVCLFPLEISGDFNPITIAKLRKFLDSHSIDIIIVNFNKDIRLGGLAARMQGNTRVVWSVGLDITRKSIVHRVLTPKLIDGVVVPSQSLKNQIIRWGYIQPESVEVIPIGIPTLDHPVDRTKYKEVIRSKYSLPDNCTIAVTAGRFVEQKGHSYLLDAIPEIIKNNPDMRFLWLGNGPLESTLRNKASHLGIESYLIFAGMLDSVHDELDGADMMIHPSVEEPFGIAILEGMRAGLPVIASNVGGIPEVVDTNCACLVDPCNGKAISVAVNNLLADKGRLTTMGHESQKRYNDNFTLLGMCNHVERYLSTVMRKKEHHD
jgi:glycosyltransferase involved in cell wall biosynthesis